MGGWPYCSTLRTLGDLLAGVVDEHPDGSVTLSPAAFEVLSQMDLSQVPTEEIDSARSGLLRYNNWRAPLVVSRHSIEGDSDSSSEDDSSWEDSIQDSSSETSCGSLDFDDDGLDLGDGLGSAVGDDGDGSDGDASDDQHDAHVTTVVAPPAAGPPPATANEGLTVTSNTWPAIRHSTRFCPPLCAVGGWAVPSYAKGACNCGPQGCKLDADPAEEAGELRVWLDEELAKAADPAPTRASNGYDSRQRVPCV